MLGWFLVFIALQLIVGWVAFQKGKSTREDYLLGDRSLSAFSVGISAAATGNSGFIMLGAVGLGYSLGITWVMLPLAWLIGDLVFWSLFPEKLNKKSREMSATTLPELLFPKTIQGWRIGRIVMGVLVISVVSTYGASQALAGSKALNSLFNISIVSGAALTVVMVGLYSILGGFRASVWTDILQGIMMLIISVGAVAIVAYQYISNPSYYQSLSSLEGHLSFFSGISLPMIVGFIVSWALAGTGFGLGQPQIVSRYFAGRDESTVRKAKWIYILYIQITWVGMTLFGVGVRSLISDVADPETTLLAYANQILPDIGVGFVLATVFAAIASTLDSIVLAVGGIVSSDLLPAISGKNASEGKRIHIIMAGITLLAVFLLAIGSSMNVFELSVLPVELVSASVGPVVAIYLLFGALSATQIIVSMFIGIAGVCLWHQTGLEPIISSAITGLASFFVLLLWVHIKKPASPGNAS